MTRFARLLPLIAAFAMLPIQAQTVQGAGASFPSKVYQRWAERYAAETQLKVEYKPTGSGDGVKQAKARSVAFGGSDSALSPAELAQAKLIQVPTAVGGVVPVVNLRGVQPDQLQLSGELLAELFAGKLKQWNDPRIAALNPGLSLPATPVRRIVRADKSGSTEGFTRYLTLMSAGFKAEVGASQLPKWPGETLAGEGNDGVARLLAATEGGIAFVSYDRVGKLSAVKLRNAAGRFVAASEAGFRAAIRESDLHKKGDDLAGILNQPGEQSWPITLTTFVLLDAEPAKAAAATPALRFFYWAFQRGDDLLKGTGFAPLPTAVQARLANRFTAVKPQDGGKLDYVSF